MMKKEHSTFNAEYQRLEDVLAISYSGGLVLTTADESRSKNRKNFKETTIKRGGYGLTADAICIALTVKGESQKNILAILLYDEQGGKYDRKKIERAVSARYDDDYDRIHDIYMKCMQTFWRYEVDWGMIESWFNKKRDKLQKQGKLKNETNPYRSKITEVTINKQQDPSELPEYTEDSAWLKHKGERYVVADGTNVVIMPAENFEKFMKDAKELDNCYVEQCNRIEELENENKSLESQLGVGFSMDWVNRSIAQVMEISGKNLELQSEIADLKAKRGILESQNTSLRNDVEKLEKEIEKLRGENTELHENLSASQTNLEQEQRRVGELKEQIEDLRIDKRFLEYVGSGMYSAGFVAGFLQEIMQLKGKDLKKHYFVLLKFAKKMGMVIPEELEKRYGVNTATPVAEVPALDVKN